ncbi:MAG: peptidoglycan bridge formation glycyltransferase FemA/FemB family protein [Candidatus Ancillula sp.]|jgi:lipid II:glycine glycyltransferase (peptidoglycan interpeptide bridge formation enzyme)|nr:peptidoglycan bridge formation glycyltransferase FemA/FemB family protein [Candidatus Ancillula sp.]
MATNDWYLGQKHFLQSPEWREFQHKLGNDTIEVNGALGIVERGKVSKLYFPYGPCVEQQSGFFEAVVEEAKTLGVDYVRVEPRSGVDAEKLTALGFVKAHKNIQPEVTAVSDLSVGFDEIFKGLPSNTRNAWRQTEKKGVTFSESRDVQDVQIFLEMLHSVAARTGMHPHPDEYFQYMAQTFFPSGAGGLFFAKVEGQVAAAVLYFQDDTTMYYAHAASFDEFRKLSVATTILVYALQEACARGLQFFDWFGVAPEAFKTPKEEQFYASWQGFTNFKLRFGGSRVTTLGTWDLPLNKLKYRLFRLLVR